MTLDATLLGFTMLIFALIIWEIVLLLKDPKGVLYGGRNNSSGNAGN
jgi:hypothetical protein